MNETNTSLKRKLELKNEMRLMGGNPNLGKLNFHFQPLGGIPRLVTLKCHESEDISVYNIHFQKDKLQEVSGNIADKLLIDFPEDFSVVAASNCIDERGVEHNYCYVEYDSARNTYLPKRDKSKKVKYFNRDVELKRLSVDEISNFISNKKLREDEAKLRAEVEMRERVLNNRGKELESKINQEVETRVEKTLKEKSSK